MYGSWNRLLNYRLVLLIALSNCLASFNNYVIRYKYNTYRKTSSSPSNTITHSVNLYHAIEFPMLLQFHPGNLRCPRQTYSLYTCPSPSEFVSQIGFLISIQFLVGKCIGRLLRVAINTPSDKDWVWHAGAYGLAGRTILVRGTFLLGLYVLGVPGRLTAQMGMLHGMPVAVWMVLQHNMYSGG
jgi:hypothetical protein